MFFLKNHSNLLLVSVHVHENEVAILHIERYQRDILLLPHSGVNKHIELDNVIEPNNTT